MTRHSLTVTALILLSCAVPARSEMQGSPVALVLAKSGSITPEVSEFSEVAAGTVLTLGADARLTFDDYYSCRQVTVTGGRIEFKSKGYHTSADAKTSEVRVACKQEVVLKQSGEASTSLMRGPESFGGRTARLGIRPTFILVGKRSLAFATARFTSNGSEVLAAPVTGPRFEWPAGAAALAEGGRYELALIPKSEGEPAETVHFVATNAPKASQDRSLVLIRAD